MPGPCGQSGKSPQLFPVYYLHGYRSTFMVGAGRNVAPHPFAAFLFSQSLSCRGLRSASCLAFSRHAVDQAPHASRSCNHCHNPLCIPAPVDDASASYYRPSHSCCHQGLLTEDFGVPASEKADSSPTAKNGQAFMPVVERIARISAIPNPGGETGSPPLFLKNRSLLL